MIENKRKGILLAGGLGTRLHPLTSVISKQLLPIYNKPMIYYPLSTLMLSGINEILIITSPDQLFSFQKLLGSGQQWGLSLKYEVQQEPKGIAQAILIAEEFLEQSPFALILGDNLFYGENLSFHLRKATDDINNATLFAYPVKDPERFGIVSFDKNFRVTNIEEKPKKSLSKYAITGLYFYDNNAIKYAKELKPSYRGELEITDLNNIYLSRDKLNVQSFGRGMIWLDTGTFDSLQEAGSFVKTLENSQGLKIGYPEEVAWRNNWIDDNQLKKLARRQSKNIYGKYLYSLLN